MDTQKDDNEKSGLESAKSNDTIPNVGTGPAKSIADGGVEGEVKQPKENTGNMTEMGGSTGGTSKAETEKVETDRI